MVRLTLIWGVLLLAGIFMVDIHAQVAKNASSSKEPETSSSKTQTSSVTTVPTSSKTTHAPSNTTSHAPSNSTTQPITHTTPVLPTKPSAPTNGHYVVNDTKGTCIIADMGLALELDNATTVKQAKEAKGKWYFNVNPKLTVANGTCSESRANLHVEFPEGSINFVFLKEGKKYYIDEVSVNFSWNSEEHWNGTAGKLKLLSTDIGYSVRCKSTPTVNLAGNLYLSMADVKLQAFDIPNNNFGKERVCYPDRKNILVPVGLALALVGLLMIIILVFLLTRRRRSSGYEQI